VKNMHSIHSEEWHRHSQSYVIGGIGESYEQWGGDGNGRVPPQRKIL